MQDDIGDCVVGSLLLVLARVKNRRTVARPDVIALTVPRRRIMDLKEELEQSAITDLVRVENDLDRLGVRPVIAIRRVRNVATGVSDSRGDHSWITSYEILHAPKAAASQHRTFS